MRRIVFALIAVLLPRGLPAQTSDGQTVQVVAETRVDSLTRQVASGLRCPVCQGLSLQDSPSSLAQEMRAVIHEQLAAGKTPDEVKKYFVARYSEWILLEPEAKGFNLTVYLLPILSVVIGILIIGMAARRWLRTSSATQPASVEETDPDLAPWEDIVAR